MSRKRIFKRSAALSRYCFRSALWFLLTAALTAGSFVVFPPREAKAFMEVTDAHRVVDTFTANGTWTAPADIINGVVQVEAWGAGGGGTGGPLGGGGGAYARVIDQAVTATDEWTVVVGTSAANTNGGDSYFALGSATSTLAKGGLSGGNGGTGGQAASSTGTTKFSGANGGGWEWWSRSRGQREWF